MKLEKVAGATGEIWQIFIQDSSSTTGAGLAGLVFNSSGLTAYYHRDTDTTATAITMVTMTVGTFTSSGFKEIDSTNMPGWYQFCPPNAALASGAKSVGIHLKGATNMAPLPIEVQLTGTNVDDAVHGGMSALPNTACTTNASLLTSGTGTDQLSVASGRTDVGKALGTAVTLDANNVLNVSAKYWAGGLIPAPNATGVPLIDAKYLLGTIFVTPATAGIMDVNAKNINNVVAATPGASGGLLIAGSNAATTFATLASTGAFSINGTSNVAQTGDSFARIGATGSGLTSLAPSATAMSTGTWTGARAAKLDFLDVAVSAAPDDSQMAIDVGSLLTSLVATSGTATAGTSNTITLQSGPSSAHDSAYKGMTIFIPNSSGDTAQFARVTGYVGSTRVATVTPAWQSTPTSSTAYYILPAWVFGAVSGDQMDLVNAPNVTAVAQIQSGLATQTTQTAVKAKTDLIATNAADSPNLVTMEGRVDAAVSSRSTYAGGAVASVTGNVGGNVTGSVGSVVAGVDLVNAPNATAVTAIANGLLDLASAIDPSGGADTLRKAMRLVLAACAGQLSGAGTTSNVVKDTTAAKSRITATVDASGNRSAVTYDIT